MSTHLDELERLLKEAAHGGFLQRDDCEIALYNAAPWMIGLLRRAEHFVDMGRRLGELLGNDELETTANTWLAKLEKGP